MYFTSADGFGGIYILEIPFDVIQSMRNLIGKYP